MEKINKKKVFAGFKFVGDGREVLRQWMADARCRTGEGTRQLIISGPMASGKTTLIRRLAAAFGGVVTLPPWHVNEYREMWKTLDKGDVVAIDDWGGGGRLLKDLQLAAAGVASRWRRVGTSDKVDVYRPNGRVVVAVSARARISEFPYLQSRCAFVQLQNRTTGRPASPARLVVSSDAGGWGPSQPLQCEELGKEKERGC